MDLIGKIKFNQVAAGEQAVLENLKSLGFSTPEEEEVLSPDEEIIRDLESKIKKLEYRLRMSERNYEKLAQHHNEKCTCMDIY